MGMLAIFIAISQTFIDGGFGAALIQKDNPTQKDYSTIFFWNLTLAIVLYAVMFCIAPSVARFYDISQLGTILRVLSIILVVNSLGLIQRVRLRKQLLFKQQAIVDFFSALIGVTVAIICAYKGLGVWSLVIYQIVLSSCQTLGLCLVHRWIPSFDFDFSSFKQLFRYGGFLLMSDLLNTLCDNIQGLIIGKRFSPMIMGYYAQARKLEEVPTTGISYVVAQVAFPFFSELKNQKSALYSAHEKSILASNYVNIPLMFLLIMVAEPLIVLLFTDKWLDSVPYFRILCVAGLANCMQSVNYQLYVATGRSKSMFKWNIVKRIVGITLILLGSLSGVKGILWGMVVGFWFTYIVNAVLAGKITGYSVMRQLSDLLPIVFMVGTAGLIIVFFSQYFAQSYFVTMFLQILVYIAVILLYSVTFKLKSYEICKGMIVDLLDKRRVV